MVVVVVVVVQEEGCKKVTTMKEDKTAYDSLTRYRRYHGT